MINSSTKLADVIHLDYRLIQILSRFNIQLGFGNKTVAEVCDEHDINTSFFLEIVRSYHDPIYFPMNNLDEFSCSQIIDYLKVSHADYLSVKVPAIQSIIDSIEESILDDGQRKVKLLNDFFKVYVEELKVHLDVEDTAVYPYIRQIEDAERQGEASNALIEQIEQDTIDKYERNHDDLEVKLSDLKNLIIKYMTPSNTSDLCQKLLVELFRLEADLEDHARIEEKVLVPKVKILERSILARYENQQ